LWVANDNDFEQHFAGPNTNPNQFFVFGFTDADLAGSHCAATVRELTVLENWSA
jgi:hypothetical protein